MNKNGKENNDIIRSKKMSFIILLCSIYSAFLFAVFMDLIGASPKSLIAFRFQGILAALFMLDVYFVFPITLICFLYIFIKNKNASQNNNKIIGEVPLIFIVMSLMVISFVFGKMYL